jgi:hypothetical protein
MKSEGTVGCLCAQPDAHLKQIARDDSLIIDEQLVMHGYIECMTH